MIYIRLFFEFFKTGLFAVGGGLATLPFLRDIAQRTGWFSQENLLDMIAVSESTPGPIGVNMATYAGFTTGLGLGSTGGLFGAFCATFGLILPAFLTILLVAKVLDIFKENKYINNAFYGLRPAVTGLIASAGLTVMLSSLFILPWKGSIAGFFHIPSVCIFLVVFICMQKTKLHPIVYILLSALCGIILGFLGII